MQLKDLVRPQAGNGEQFKHPFGHLFAQLVEARMRAALVNFGYDVGDRIADTRNLGKRACRDEAL